MAEKPMIRLQGNFTVTIFPKLDLFSILVYLLSSTSVSVKVELVFLIYEYLEVHPSFIGHIPT